MNIFADWWNRHFVTLVWLMAIAFSVVFWSILTGGAIAALLK